MSSLLNFLGGNTMKSDKKLRKVIVYLITSCLVILVILQVVFAGTTGKIVGKVVDAKTGEPLPGVNVVIDGTTYGAATDKEGNYFILNIPPGIYSVSASMMGYTRLKQTDVRVSLDKTTVVNFSLSSTVIAGKEVVVVAERSVIKADIANTQTVLQGDQIAAMPVSQFKDVLDKQVGIRTADARGLFFRGEREFGVSMRIEGLETRDNVDNQIETRINPDAVEEANVLTGGFSAEYGDAIGGVVNVVMKEGGDTYQATFDGMQSIPARKHFGPPLKYYWDEKIDNDSTWNALATDYSSLTGIYEQFRDKPELLRELYLWRMRDEVTKYDDKPDLNYRGTFGGPVPFLKNTTFFLSGRYEKTYYLFNQASPYYDNLGFSGKITSHITPNLKLSFTGRYMELMGINRYDRRDPEMGLGIDVLSDPNQTRENRYVFESVEDIAWTTYREAQHLSPWPYVDMMSISNRFKNQYGLKLTHALSRSTFYEVSLLSSNFRVYGSPRAERDTTRTVTLRDRQGNTAVLTGEYALAPDGYWFENFYDDPLEIVLGSGNRLGSTHGSYEVSQDKTFLLRAMIISQINKTNQITAGFEFNYVDLYKHERREGSDGRFYFWNWHVFPKTFSMWLQDKLEFEGMIANIGLRADVRIPHHNWMNLFDDSTRYDYHWAPNFIEGHMDKGLLSTGPYYKPPVKWVLSPRLSISHPISSIAKIFFNYAHQNQNPPYEYQYKIMLRYPQSETMFGNPELPYIKTIQYEVGYEQNIADLFFIAISGFYRNVSNKIDEIRYMGRSGQRLGDLEPELGDRSYQTDYRLYSPDRYSKARGLEIKLEKRVGRFWTGWFNYDYEIFTSGRRGFSTINEVPTTAPSPRNYEGTKLLPMPRLNLGVDLHTPVKFGPAWGFFHPIADMQLNVLFWWRSQPAFTYNPDRARAPYDPRYNKRWKPHHATNLTFSKRFDFGIFVTPILYIQIYNVFNTKNMFRGAFTPDELEDYIELLEEHNKEHGTNYKPGDKEDFARQVIGNELDGQGGPGFTQYDLFLNPRQIFLGLRLEIK